ncbi:acyltransferase [Allofranklinella schreckenbergeri]|uniref:Acyltransferase n=1 Tax=Allofranklinella schreckenbergeri TaxID=1076744 RepID=A0A3M6R766_9BURK|nr:acyltransferase [Allofranklinella schreckenbergeri]RMX11196.1 acyltransferase [Allofranklinella schreckenbergeri]
MHKSSSGMHLASLDHIRALAAFMVVSWHFLHSTNGHPVAFEGAPFIFPLALLDEGHTGVALFMTLSGYLFTRLLEGKNIDYKRFIMNRMLRLLPLLLFVMLLNGVNIALQGGDLIGYSKGLIRGIWEPSWPNGGWSITVELHFYIILPLLLYIGKRNQIWLILLIAIFLLLRINIWKNQGQVQFLAYATLIGRLDQFALGMLACHWRSHMKNKHTIAFLTLASFSIFYWLFDHQGGFYLFPQYPSPSKLWIALPFIEGLCYAIVIAWYESSFNITNTNRISRWLSQAGAYSYSIYLLHFFFVFDFADYIHKNIMEISNFYIACIWSFIFYLSMMIPAHFSYRFIESPFLRMRASYLKKSSNH